MTKHRKPKWDTKRTAESRMVENALRSAGFERVDAYRYNSASLRIRVVDSRFEAMSQDQRDALVEPELDKLPEATQSDIVNLVLLSPSELDQPSDAFREFLMNTEFEYPSPSML
jgi:hypothetical protein